MPRSPQPKPARPAPTGNPPLRDAVAVYSHKHGWSKRLIAGDSLRVMNSLPEKEGLAGQVHMINLTRPMASRTAPISSRV